MKLYELLNKHAANAPQRAFLHVPRNATAAYHSGPIEFTYRTALDAVERIRLKLADAGVGPGHRIALALDNRADFFLVLLALNSLDASVVPLNMDLAVPELAHVLGHSDAALILALPEHHEKLTRAVTQMPKAIDISAYSSPSNFFLPVLNGPREPIVDAALVYTSGTTGAPKGCLLSEQYFLFTGEWYRDLGGLCALEPGRERLLTPLPTFHVNSLVFSFMASLTTGGCLIQLDRFHPRTWWDSVWESKATALHYLGVMPAMLLELPPAANENFKGQVKFAFGAGVEPEHHAEFEKRFGFPLVEGWAMTETGAGGCFMVTEEPRHVGTRCIGRPPPNIEYRIVDDQLQNVERGEPGELLIRAAGCDSRRGFFSGYHRDEEATRSVWTGGWLHTGDVVIKGPDDSLFFVDRRKNIIRRSGENIAVSEVENVLLKHPDVSGCAVAPVKDRIRGEEVFACIVPAGQEGEFAELANSLHAFCSERLAYYKVPGYITFVSNLPTTATQKINRGEMKRLVAQKVATGDCIDLRDRKRKPTRRQKQ